MLLAPWSKLNGQSPWVSTSSALSRWHDGKWTALRTPHDQLGPGLPTGSGSLFQDSRGRVWFGGHAAFGYFENDRFIAAIKHALPATARA